MRAAPFILACGLVIAAPLSAPADRVVPSPAVDSLAARVEPLFALGSYDSILAFLPGVIHDAGARADSVLLGRALTQRGRVFLMKGDRSAAVADIETGIRIAEAIGDTTGLMPAVHFRGFAYLGQGEWDEAMRCFRRRLDLALLVHSPLDEAWARTSIGFVHHQRGSQQEARAEYHRAIALFREGGRLRLELTALIGLGRVESALGNQREAIRCYQRVWVVSREVGDRVNEMWATNNLGVLEGTKGDLSRAAEYQERAYAIARELAYPEGIVVPATNLAGRALERGDFARADAILRETRALCVAKSDLVSLDIVDVSIANLRLSEGKPRDAARILERLLTPIDRLDSQHRDYAMLMYVHALASVDSAAWAMAWFEDRLAAGDIASSDAQPEIALYAAYLYGETNRVDRALVFATRARELALREGQIRTGAWALLRESIYQRLLGRPAEAALSLHAALDTLEAFRGGISSAEWRETYGESISPGVIEAARVLLEYPDSARVDERVRAFFDTMQRFKTRTLMDRISDPRFGPGGASEPRGPVTLSEAQAVLRPGEVLLDFHGGDSRTFLLAVTPDSCRLVELPGVASPLAERIDLFRSLVASADPVTRAEYPPQRMAASQAALGNAVFGDVADLIAGASRLFVSPDGFYSKIPFGLLMLHDDVLMADRDVILVPSASLLARARNDARVQCDGPTRVIAFGADEHARLPGARDEVNELGRRYRRVDRAVDISGGDAFAGALGPCDVLHVAAHALVVDRSPWDSGIRIAGGEDADTTTTRAASPARSNAILSAADSMLVARTFPGDPYLRAWRIAGLSIRARLAVLAACETAGGRATSGEGTLGITAAFLSAGVPVVVASLWPVDDRATERVMSAFYRRLSRGAPVATALREAQLEVSRLPGMAHPFMWAGFTVVGDGTGSVPLDRRLDPLVPTLFLLAASLAATVVIVRRRRARAGMR
jgi:CHAT domain-containing protein/tetratricopeptide (TPR) repeat protein